ncbi:hypothetical protein B0H13DRAFT_1877119 [Mycena leptocephala]|nr:hypothetical protein B0H13DRAFT_1877119 [Mycena leptocephala]
MATPPSRHPTGRKAILPVLNQAKMDLFRTMMSESNSFGNFSSEEKVTAGVRIWNGKADADVHIFYKALLTIRASHKFTVGGTAQSLLQFGFPGSRPRFES